MTPEIGTSVAPPVIPGAPTREVAPSIADVSYRGYDGELRDRSARWWTITRATLRSGFKKLGYWIPGGLVLLIYLISGLVFYFTRNVRAQFGGEAPVNQYAVVLDQGLGGTGLLLFIAALTIGAGSIAADNRANALLVYLSKPITRLDYLVGKWIGLFLLLAALSFVPALLMFLFFAVAYSGDGFLKENPTLILRLAGATLFPAALHASLVLGISACSKSPRLAGSLYAALYFVTLIVALTAGNLMQSRDKGGKNGATIALVSNLSVSGVVNGLAEHLYNLTPRQIVQNAGGRRRFRKKRPGSDEEMPPITIPERPPLVPLLLIGGALIVFPIGVAAARVRAVEVVSG